MQVRHRLKSQQLTNKSQGGFTLIELMIVILIVGVLAGLAMASFGGSTEKARRTDARTALLNLAENQEKYYLVNNGYTNDITIIGGASTEKGYYTISVVTDGLAVNDGTVYTLTATPVANGPQSGDTACSGANVMTLNSVGQKGPPYCW